MVIWQSPNFAFKFSSVYNRQPHGSQQSTVAEELDVTLAVRGLLEKYPTFGREKETGLLGALDT